MSKRYMVRCATSVVFGADSEKEAIELFKEGLNGYYFEVREIPEKSDE